MARGGGGGAAARRHARAARRREPSSNGASRLVRARGRARTSRRTRTLGGARRPSRTAWKRRRRRARRARRRGAARRAGATTSLRWNLRLRRLRPSRRRGRRPLRGARPDLRRAAAGERQPWGAFGWGTGVFRSSLERNKQAGGGPGPRAGPETSVTANTVDLGRLSHAAHKHNMLPWVLWELWGWPHITPITPITCYGLLCQESHNTITITVSGDNPPGGPGPHRPRCPPLSTKRILLGNSLARDWRALGLTQGHPTKRILQAPHKKRKERR